MKLLLHAISIVIPLCIMILLHYLLVLIPKVKRLERMMVMILVGCIDLLLLLFIAASLYTPVTRTVLQETDYTQEIKINEKRYTIHPAIEEDGKLYFYYMKKTENGAITDRIPASRVTDIQETSYRYRIEKYAELPWFLPVEMEDTWNSNHTYYHLYVPVGCREELLQYDGFNLE